MATSTGHGQPGLSRTKLTGAGAKGYSVASIWEKQAQLDEEQIQAVEALAAFVSQRPLPAHVADQPAAAGAQDAPRSGRGAPDRATAPSPAATAANRDAGAGFSGSFEDAVLHNANEFLKWHSQLEAACASEAEQKYQNYAALLQDHLGACDALRSKVDQTVGLLDTLVALHHDVGASSADISSGCEALLQEKAALQEFADALRARLAFFDGFEKAAAEFAAVQANPSAAQLLPLLGRLDEAISYVAANPQYADSITYAAKFRQLQARALGLVRSQVQAVLRTASQQVQAAVLDASGAGAGGSGGGAAGGALARQGSGGGRKQMVPLLPEGQEVSLLYVRFRAAAEPGLRGILPGIEARASRAEYQRLMDECRGLYCMARQQLVAPFAAARLATLGGLELPELLRGGAEQLLRSAQLEAQLYEQLFGPEAPKGAPGQQPAAAPPPAFVPAGEALRPLLEPLATQLYDALRPRFVQLSDIDSLVDLIDILQGEVLSEQHVGPRAAPVLGALRPVLAQALSDLQHRLIYRAQAFIKQEVAGLQPGPADCDFPARLERLAQEEAAAAGEISPAAEGAEAAGGSAAAAEAVEEREDDQGADPLARWYGPVRSTLLLLSKLYRCLPAKTFAGLAHEAVEACTGSVQRASAVVARASGPLDGQLFAIMHLLLLREQIAQFDVDFAVTDTDLDFSHMRNHMRRIVSGEVSLFALSASNAVVQMLGRSGPRVVTAQSDSKRDLEQQLKASCEGFIMSVTKLAIEPMLGFITKVTAVRVAASNNPAAARPLREQAFASADKLSEVVARVNAAMAGPVPEAAAKACLYLSNPATRAILFRPIKSNIAEAHGQIAQLLEAEYTQEEAAAVPLMQPDALGTALEF